MKKLILAVILALFLGGCGDDCCCKDAGSSDGGINKPDMQTSWLAPDMTQG